MSKKIAPTLAAVLSDLWTYAQLPPMTDEKAGDTQVLRIARAELRALLAVARAQAALLEEVDEMMAHDPMFMWGRRSNILEASRKARWAGRRLSRVSGGKP